MDEVWCASLVGPAGGFTIDNDSKAEWALKKILERRKERDRLLVLADEEIERLQQKRNDIVQKCDDDTGYLESMLQSYMDTVKCRELKSCRKYQLLSGSLVMKHGGTEFKRDDDKLVRWLEFHDRGDLIKRTAAPRWSDLKKMVAVSGDACVDVLTGEVIDGLTAEEKPDTFSIEEAKDV